MRIGEFSEHNNLSIDTIRYYVDLNLIHPIKRGKYFYFEKEQQEELDELLYLKRLRFTLDEIKKISTAQILSKIEMSAKSSIYQDILIKKKDELKSEVSEISMALKILEDEIKRAGEKNEDTYKERGIPFGSLDILCCPRCGKSIEISEGILKGGGISQGKSECTCGYSLSIDRGIIVTKRDFSDIIDPYIDGKDYAGDFAKEVPKEFAEYVMESLREIIKLLLDKGLPDKTLLFMNSGLGVLETNLLGQSNDIKLMIMVDADFNKLRVAKRTIESNYPGNNIIYICSELYELPLKKKTVDIAVDFLASFLGGFRTDASIYERVIPLLKDRSSIIGLYMYFKHFRMLSRLPESRRYIFDGRAIPRIIGGFNFSETGHRGESILHEGSNINGFFRDGDEVYSRIMVFDRKQA